VSTDRTPPVAAAKYRVFTLNPLPVTMGTIWSNGLNAKRAKVSDDWECNGDIRTLPADAIKVIMQYEKANVLPMVCSAFHAISTTFTPYHAVVRDHTLPAVLQYPHNTSTTARVTLRACNRKAMECALRGRGFSKTRPRFSHATTLVIYARTCDIANEDWFDVISALVCIKKIRSLRVIEGPGSLQLLAQFHAAGAFPDKLEIELPDVRDPRAELLKAVKELYLTVYEKGQPENRWRIIDDLCPEARAVVILDPRAKTDSIEEIIERFPSLYKLMVGKPSDIQGDHFDIRSDQIPLLRGGQWDLVASYRQFSRFAVYTIPGARATAGLLRRRCAALSVMNFPYHVMLVALRRYRHSGWRHMTHASYVPFARSAILEETPTRAKFTMEEWTTLRAAGLVLLSSMYWDDSEIYTSLLRTWITCCGNALTGVAFVRAAVKELDDMFARCDREMCTQQCSRLGLKFIARFVVPRVLEGYTCECERRMMITQLEMCIADTVWQDHEISHSLAYVHV